jgi:hypothetical protein
MNKKVIVASALFAALITPAIAFGTQTETQTAAITIDKAVGATPASTATISSGAAPEAPASGTSGSATNVDLSNTTAVNAWSNHDGWDASVYGASLEKTGVPLAAALSVASYSGSCGTYNAVGANSGAATSTVVDGSKNTTNNAQTVAVCFRQPISWTDDAGAYSTTLTHQVIPVP